ncbi:MAG: hypothetical protein AVDCRST_MAG66-1582, partial [uncultured Pseudonocardia sp.]
MQAVRADHPVGLVARDETAVERIEQAQRGGGVAGVQVGRRAGDVRADRRRERHQPVVQRHDGRPVRATREHPAVVHRLDRRLQLVGARAVPRGGEGEVALGLRHQRGVPPPDVLPVERHERPLLRAPCPRPGLAVQQRGQQAAGLRLVGQQLDDEPGQAQRLVGEAASAGVPAGGVVPAGAV